MMNIFSRFSRLLSVVHIEFGGWRAYFARQGVWHGLGWLVAAF